MKQILNVILEKPKQWIRILTGEDIRKDKKIEKKR